MVQRVIALLGRPDQPTDAIEQYCGYLGSALGAGGFGLELHRVAWDKDGWSVALRELDAKAASWANMSVLAQYTALAWSRRGFPLRFLSALRVLRRAQARPIVVFHDPKPFPGGSIGKYFRRAVQIYAMRHAASIAAHAVFTIPLEQIAWLDAAKSESTFIPIGANLSVPCEKARAGTQRGDESTRNTPSPAVAVFTITEGEPGDREMEDIIAAVRYAANRAGQLSLRVFGRGAMGREETFKDRLRGVPVCVFVEGLLTAAQISDRLASCDVLLFVRGPISSGRGSAIAGIACGLPVVGYQSSDTASPITDAGVVLVPYQLPEAKRQKELSEALWRVLSDTNFRAELAARSQRAFATHFSWDAVAKQFLAIVKSPTATASGNLQHGSSAS